MKKKRGQRGQEERKGKDKTGERRKRTKRTAEEKRGRIKDKRAKR